MNRTQILGAAEQPMIQMSPSPTQLGLLTDSLVANDKGVNVEQVLCKFDGRFDPDAMRSAWSVAVCEFDALRLQFVRTTDGSIVQNCLDNAVVPFQFLDWSSRQIPVANLNLEDFIRQDRHAGFQLFSAPLLRLTLIHLPEEKSVVVWTVHHSIIDGSSYPIVFKRVLLNYWEIVAGRPAEIIHQPSFMDFLSWQSRYKHELGVEYFRKVLSGFTEPSPLPFVTRGRFALHRSNEAVSRIDSKTTKALLSTAEDTNTSLNAIVQLAWGLLIGRYAGSDDIVFGSTWSGRQLARPHANQTVGLFVNTLPVRVDVSLAGRVQDALISLRKQHLESRPFHNTSLALIQAELGYSRARQLFQTIIVFEKEKPLVALEAEAVSGLRMRFQNNSQTGYPLCLIAHVCEGELVLQLEYDVGLYNACHADQLLDNLTRLVSTIPGALERDVHDLPLLAPELESTLTTIEAEREPVPSQPPLIAQILEQVEQRPDACAVVDFLGRSISYSGLIFSACRVAKSLQESGVGDGDIVSILIPRSIDAIVAQLAVQLSGAAFLMLDCEHPQERLRYMVADTGSKWLLVSPQTTVEMDSSGCQVLNIEWLLSRSSVDELLPISTLKRTIGTAAADDRLAYVIYTSGSTGKPKGVRISERSLANHVVAIRKLYSLEPLDRALQFFALSFDASLEEIFPTLVAGATLVLRDELVANSAREFFKAIAAHQITVLNLPTAFWHQLVQLDANRAWPSCLRLLIVGGERVSPTVHSLFRAGLTDHIRWLNCYGPTETTITSAAYDDCVGDHSSECIPIGTPLPGHSHFVLDHRLRPVPPGATGQLFIGGTGLALGYHGRPSLTDERFIYHPWRNGRRLYATGDLVWRTQRGNLVYAGRTDHQVKIRGFRVELGEIEVRLQQHPEVRQAVAVVQENPGSNSRLVAFIESSTDITPMALRSFAADTLPAYMVPDQIIVCPILPVTVAGKIDRKALEKLVPTHVQKDSALGSDADPIELVLMELWSQILETPIREPLTNFFESGGNSMLVLKLLAEIERRFQKPLNPTRFFERPTIAHLAQLIRQTIPDEIQPLIVGLTPGNDKIRPLFLTPGVTGRGVDYVHLVKWINPEVPLYAIHMPGLNESQDRYRDTRVLASDFADAMQAVQPKGPYALAGYSAGCIVAVAISEVLLKRGQRIDFVGLIDGTPPASLGIPSPFTSPWRFTRLLLTLMDRIGEILAQPDWNRVLWLRGRRALRSLRSGWKHGDRGYELSVENLFAGQGFHFSENDRQIMQSRLTMLMAYEPNPIAIDVTLFRVARDPFEGPYAPDLGWSRIVRGKVSIEMLPGRHQDILGSSNSRLLAQKMNRHLATRQSSLNSTAL